MELTVEWPKSKNENDPYNDNTLWQCSQFDHFGHSSVKERKKKPRF